MKKILLVFILIISFFAFDSVLASSTFQAKITGNEVGLRTGPGTNYSRIGSLALGSSYDLGSTELVNDEKGCSAGWYKVFYDSSTTGYVCSNYVEVIEIKNNDTGNATTACEIELANAGFPSSYWSGLCALKEQHPTWSFQAIKTNLDWSTAVEEESSCGISYVSTTNEEWMDRSCYNTYGWNSNWKNASQTAVAYYMDPRNFFNERRIFMFEYLKYDNNLSNAYVNSAISIIKNAAFYNYHLNNGVELGDVINNAGKDSDVSPTFLSARMLQELGNSTTLVNLYSGAYTGYDNTYLGYYNFFNYGVSDSCATGTGPTLCGLAYAKSKGWNSPYNAILGASNSMSSGYIKVGQYTNYLQKFNVVPTNLSRLYSHQYMTNIAAPYSESSSTYNSYVKMGVLESPFVFYIPVYNNMTNEIVNSSGGGTGEEGETTVATMPISTIVTSSGYKYTSKYLSNVSPGTDVSTIIGAIQSVSGNGTVSVTDRSGNIVTNGMIGTGFKISISNNVTTEVLEVVIKGDTSGDGVVNALDLLQVQKHILQSYNLSGSTLEAGDTSKDGSITALDLLQVQKVILGTYTIEQ